MIECCVLELFFVNWAFIIRTVDEFHHPLEFYRRYSYLDTRRKNHIPSKRYAWQSFSTCLRARQRPA
eukprot:scaffold3210_cov113-Cylindrotheca_fusiformis.AAC.2